MSKINFTDQEGTKWAVSLLRYALAVSDKALISYSIIMMLIGGILALWLLAVVVMGVA